jgi:4-hydroxy-4-methyl-2-oxoglutarate aldolase
MTLDGNGSVYMPPVVRPADFRRVSQALLQDVMNLPGAAATASDVLDSYGLSLAVPADVLRPRSARKVIAGQALTMSYLPDRRAPAHLGLRQSPSHLGHPALFPMASAGDVIVIDARGSEDCSVLGGAAAASAIERGIAACVVDGGVRDLDEIERAGLSVWSRSLTPRTGRWRVEAFALNLPVSCGGVQVIPGDVVVADHTGVCFVPVELAGPVLRRVVEISAQEAAEIKSVAPSSSVA